MDSLSVSTEHAIKAYLGPILRSAEVMVSQGYIADWIERQGSREELDSYLADHIPLIGCDTIDIASSLNETVYQTGGTETVMSPDNERDFWYYDFMDSEESSNIEFFYNSLEGRLYIYYNHKIFNQDESPLGVMGVLIQYKDIAGILSEFQKKDLNSYFINQQGEIVIHVDQSRIGQITIYDYYGMLQKESERDPEQQISLDEDSYRKITYIEELNCYLVIEENQTKLFLFEGLSPFGILLLLILVVTLNIPFWHLYRKTVDREKKE